MNVFRDEDRQPGDPANSVYFGTCPECGKSGTVLNILRDHWVVCHEHKMKWHIGTGLFSGWQSGTQADWSRNAALLATYQHIEMRPKP